MTTLKRFFYSLQYENNRSFYMAFLRVAISVWLLKEICISLPYLTEMYGSKSFVVVKNDPLFNLLNFEVSVLRYNYIPLLLTYIAFLLLNIFGIGKNITAFFVFFFTEIFFRMNMYLGNGGLFMCRFILLYLVFANTYSYFTFSKQKKEVLFEWDKFSIFLTNISAYAIMIHLCLAYLVSAFIKVQSPMWQEGTVMYYIFSLEAFNGTGGNASLAKYTWLVKFITWYTLIFEFAFPFFIWFKQSRRLMIIMGVLLHIGIYFLMMIYGFQFVFLLIYGLFFTDKEWLSLIEKIKNRFPFKKITYNSTGSK